MCSGNKSKYTFEGLLVRWRLLINYLLEVTHMERNSCVQNKHEQNYNGLRLKHIVSK